MGMLQYLRLTPCRVEYTLFLFLHILNTTKLPYLNHTFVILNNLDSCYFKNIPDFEERNGVDLCLFLKFDSLYAIAFNDPFFCTELFQHSLFFSQFLSLACQVVNRGQGKPESLNFAAHQSVL